MQTLKEGTADERRSTQMKTHPDLRSSAFICGCKLICISLCVLCVLCGSIAFAEFPTSQPYDGVTYHHETRTDPPMKIFVVTVDLADPNVSVEVAPGGDDPDGPAGKWQTRLDETGDVATRESFDVAVNGDFFSVEEVIDPQTGKKRGYHEGQAALVVGAAMTDGRQWSKGEKARPAIVVTRDRRADVIDDAKKLPPGARQVISGSHVLVEGGKKVVSGDSSFVTARHPRTAVGAIDRGRKLVLVVVDGRRPQASVGMSLDELAELMLQLGCEEALNLDGGGSSTLVLRNPDNGQLVTMNSPSDGKQRPVANVLGVTVKRPTTAPAGAK